MRRVVFLLVPLFIATGLWAQSKSPAVSEISVSATSSLSTEPGIAEFRLSIISRQEQAVAAYRAYARTYDALQKSLRGVVDSTSLRTANLSVSPYFNYKKPGQVTPEYYQVIASMSLSIPLSELNKVLASITSVEGVTINGVQFRVKDEERQEMRALEFAVKQAREKAEAIARLEGLTDLKVKTMTTSTTRPPIMPMYNAMAVEATVQAINASSVSVSATVNVTYTATSK